MKKLLYISILFIVSSIALSKDGIPSGLYLELFLGAKSGGGSRHQELVAKLKRDDFLQGFEFFCIKGRSRSSDSNVPGYAIDRERRLPPTITKQCKGSAAVLMGPVQGENIETLTKHLDKNHLHLYSELRNIP